MFQRALPRSEPYDEPFSASIPRAHVKGPFRAPSEKSIHDVKNMHIPASDELNLYTGKEIREL
ncbi:hypothetical protein BUE80_DR008700 [Diplocarpon rosae]|nr:hypothetical protein BUE80_DR008700 [Diplocarpon rosae]